MNAPESRVVEHYKLLQELRENGLLAPAGRNASISNAEWFHPIFGRTPTRKQMHEELVHELVGAARPRIASPPIAILLAGPPGSGKSSARRALFDVGDEQVTGGLDAADFVAIDADGVKEKLLDIAERDGSLQSFLVPDEAKALQAKGEVFSKLDFASLVHEESSMIADAVREAAMKRRCNLILDQVCSNSKKTAALVDKLVDRGYSVRVVEIHAEKEFSEQSVFLRYLRDQERTEGRYVPTEVIESVYSPDGTSRPRQSVQGLLEARPCQIDAYRRFDARTVGQPPVLTQRGYKVNGRIQLESVSSEPQRATATQALPTKSTVLASFPKPPGAASSGRSATLQQAKLGRRPPTRRERGRGR